MLYYESVLEQDGEEPGRLDAPLHGARHGALPRRRLGTDNFDSIGTLEAWREKGVAPAQLTAANAAGVDDASALPVSAVREVQGHRQLQGRRELDLRGAVGEVENS